MLWSLFSLLIMLNPGASAASTFGDVILSLQKQGLQDFVIKAPKYKDMAELLDHSHLQWSRGFAVMKESAKGMKIPQIFAVKNGIEFVSDGKKISLEASPDLYTFIVNGREFTLDPTLDLNINAINLEKHLLGNKGSMLSLFPEAKANLLLIGVATVLLSSQAGLDVAVAIGGCLSGVKSKNSTCLKGAYEETKRAPLVLPTLISWGAEKAKSYLRKSSIYCSLDYPGSFEIDAMDLGEKKENLISYAEKINELKVQGKKVDLDKIVLSKKIQDYKHANYDYNRSLDRTNATIHAEIKEISDECKKNPDQHYTWAKTSLEKSIEGVHGSLRPKTESAK